MPEKKSPGPSSRGFSCIFGFNQSRTIMSDKPETATAEKLVPYNTAPMTFDEREKELEKSGSGTPLAPKKEKGKKKKKK